MSADTPRPSVPAVFEGGAVRLLSPAPFADGADLTVAVAEIPGASHVEPDVTEMNDRPVPQDSVTAREDEADPEQSALEDPLLSLIGIIKDGPPDWSENFDDYRFGRKPWPDEQSATDGEEGAA